MPNVNTQVLPLNLRKREFTVNDLYVVVGLPDREAHWETSLAQKQTIDGQENRIGFASQIGAWRTYFEPVRFSAAPLEDDHQLANAEIISPSLAGKRIGYQTHQKRLQLLKDAGVDVRIGATSRDFIDAANLAFQKGGLLSVIANARGDRQAIEFTDGFFPIDSIPVLRPPGGTGVCDLVGCRFTEVAQSWKAALGPSIWMLTWPTLLSVHYWLRHRLSLYTRIARGPPLPLPDQMLATNRHFNLLVQEVYS